MELSRNSRLLAIIGIIILVIFLLIWMQNHYQISAENETSPQNETVPIIYTFSTPLTPEDCTDCVMTENALTFESEDTDLTTFFEDGAVQSSGKILAGGRSGITRYNLNGTRDTTFGTSGWVDVLDTIPLVVGFPWISHLEVDTSDNIFVSYHETGGFNNPGLYYILKYLPDGAIDTSFGTNGVYTIDNNIVPDNQRRHSMVIHETTGSIYFITDRGGFMGKLLSNGQLDTSFGTNGYLSFTWNGFSGADLFHFSIDLYQEKLYVNIYERDAAINAGVIKFNLDGTKDTSYGTNGDAVFDFTTVFGTCQNTYLDSYGGGVGPDGSHWSVVTFTYDESGTCSLSPIAVIKFTPDGQVDTSFADDGLFVDVAEPYWSNNPSYSESFNRPVFNPCNGSFLTTVVNYGDDDATYILQLTSDGTQILNSTNDSLITNAYLRSGIPHPDGYFVAIGEDFSQTNLSVVKLFNCDNLDYRLSERPW